MFQGQKFQPNTKFQFVNYEQSSSPKSFKESKRPKSAIPYTMKFQLNNSSPRGVNGNRQINATHTVTMPAAQTHTFVADRVLSSQKANRKASYTILTRDQKVALLNIMLQKKVYAAKSKLDAWADVVNTYNDYYHLKSSEGLTVQHARGKYNQILAAAEKKNKDELMKEEVMALKYSDDKEKYQYEHTKDVKIDKRYENKNPKPTKVYDLITKLQFKLDQTRDTIQHLKSQEKFKTELWLLHKRVLDLKTIEEQYQILEQVDYHHEGGARVRVSREMREEIYLKAQKIQDELAKVLNDIDVEKKELKNDQSVVDGVVVDTQLLDKK